jgi:hypothetical protein
MSLSGGRIVQLEFNVNKVACWRLEYLAVKAS